METPKLSNSSDPAGGSMHGVADLGWRPITLQLPAARLNETLLEFYWDGRITAETLRRCWRSPIAGTEALHFNS